MESKSTFNDQTSLFEPGIIFHRFLHCTEEDLQPFIKRLNDKVNVFFIVCFCLVYLFPIVYCSLKFAVFFSLLALILLFFFVFKFSLDTERDRRIRRGVFTRRPLRHRNKNRGAAVQFRCHTSGDRVTQSLLGDQHERSFGDYHGHTVLRRKDPRVSHALLTRTPPKKMFCELKMFRRTKAMVAFFLAK